MGLDYLEIRGGVPLKGEVEVTGAKNAVTKMIVASLLSDKKCRLLNVPNISEVEVTLDLCRELGMEIVWDKESHTLELETKKIKTRKIPQRFSGANRIPYFIDWSVAWQDK